MAGFEPKSFALKGGGRIVVRSAVPEDVPALVDLAADAFSTSDYLATGPAEVDGDQNIERAKVDELLAKPDHIPLIALAQGRPIGRLNFRANPKKRMAHHGSIGMYAHSRWRGRGVGRALLESLVEWASVHPSIEMLRLGVMAPNAPALHLYESIGFVREEWRTREFRLGPGRYCDDIKMYMPVKPITDACERASDAGSLGVAALSQAMPPHPPGPRLNIDLHGLLAPPPVPWHRTASFTGPRQAGLRDGTAVTIRQPEESDAAAIVAHGVNVLSTSDYTATTLDEFRETYTEAKEREWICEMRSGPGHLALLAEAEGRMMGMLSFRVEPRERMAHHGHFGIGINEAWRGRGIGRVLIECLLDWAADHPSVEKVCLGVMGPNTRAFDLYHRMGFIAEGVRVREFKVGPGRYYDGVEMSLFVKPW